METIIDIREIDEIMKEPLHEYPFYYIIPMSQMKERYPDVLKLAKQYNRVGLRCRTSRRSQLAKQQYFANIDNIYSVPISQTKSWKWNWFLIFAILISLIIMIIVF